MSCPKLAVQHYKNKKVWQSLKDIDLQRIQVLLMVSRDSGIIDYDNVSLSVQKSTLMYEF